MVLHVDNLVLLLRFNPNGFVKTKAGGAFLFLFQLRRNLNARTKPRLLLTYGCMKRSDKNTRTMIKCTDLAILVFEGWQKNLKKFKSMKTSDYKSFAYLENGDINFTQYETIKSTSKLDSGSYKLNYEGYPKNQIILKTDSDFETTKTHNFLDKEKIDNLYCT